MTKIVASDKYIRMWHAGNSDRTVAEWHIAAGIVDFQDEVDGTKTTRAERVAAVVAQLYDWASGQVDIPSAGVIRQWAAFVAGCRKAGYTGNFAGMTISPATAYKVARRHVAQATNHDEVAAILRNLPAINAEFNQQRSAAALKRKAEAPVKAAEARRKAEQAELEAAVAAEVNPVNPAHDADGVTITGDSAELAADIAAALGIDITDVIRSALESYAADNGLL